MEYTLFHDIYFFFLYSFLGWVFEEILAAFRYGKFVNRGFVNGPICMKYGICMIIILTDISDLMQNPLIQLIVCFVIITVIQYIAGAVIKRVTGRRMWDYSSQKWNLNGYVSFQNSLFWAIVAILCIWLVHPFFYILYELVPIRIVKIVELIIMVVFLIDLFVTAATLLKWKMRGNLYENVVTTLEKTKEGMGQKLFLMIQKRMYRAFPEMEHQAKTEQDGFGKPVGRVFAKGLCFDKLFWVFFISALVGDWIETVFVWLTAGKLMSRSSLLYGTFSVVWGLGGAIATGLLYSLKGKQSWKIFVAGFFMGGVYEYSCSVFTEVVFGTTFWDYSHLPFNINGRINLLFCFFWGALAIVWLRLLYPAVSKVIEKIPPVTGKILTYIAVAVMVLNMLVSGVAIHRYVSRKAGITADTQVGRFLDHTYPDALIEWVYPNMKITD